MNGVGMGSREASLNARESLASWQWLREHAGQMKSVHLAKLFEDDSKRFNRLSIELPGLLFDYSKNRINEDTLSGLMRLAREAGVEAWREKMFSGERINITEDRAVLHTALRDLSGDTTLVDGDNISEQVQGELARIKALCERVRSGSWKGFSGKAITDVVSIGVGGSNLGPKMVTEALKGSGNQQIKVHYVSNVDGVQISEILRGLNPEQVLFVVSSKTFTTQETMTNARTALNWLKAYSFDTDAAAKHFVAVTANTEKAEEFGILAENIYSMWDWVGGRFSLWSAIGLPIALSLGFDEFSELLRGAYEMDCHFREAPLEQNAPVLLALLSIWNTTFMGCQAQAILPYDQSLHVFSAYMQQAEMESNGKSVNRFGEEVDYQTVPLIWGQLGIDGQHAFYQYLHQGKSIVPADFIGSLEGLTSLQDQHEILLSNLFAQTRALMLGVDEETVREELAARGKTAIEIDSLVAHKVHKGNRPTNTLLVDKICARSLGRLIALYEHKVFVQGIVLNICSFDQWGVELGKKLATSVYSALVNDEVDESLDSSTASLIKYYKDSKEAAS